MHRMTAFLLGLLALIGFSEPALALLPDGYALSFQPAATPVAERIQEFHSLLFIIITGIVIFVMGLLLYVMLRFNAKANPVPSQTTHNTLLEVVWTAVPVIILIIIAIPSFKLLYYQDRAVDPEMTLKVTGYQWYWGYEYPDENIIFDSYMIEEKDLKANQPRLLAVDNEVVVPVGKVVKVLITANDVLHAWALPSFGVKRDAVPGRINETWFKADKIGIYYGMCSELCGVNHQSMPIEVHVVSEEAFNIWVEESKLKYANKNSLIANN